LWISKKDLEAKLHAKYREGNSDCMVEQLKKQIPFSDYYAERLEWWKKQFDKEPEPYRIRINTNNTPIWVEHTSKAEQMEEFDLLLKTINAKQNVFTVINDDDRPETILISSIVSIEQFEGHPEPYTDEEVTVWAKEQLEKEMQGWKVVREEPKSAMEVVAPISAENHELHMKLRNEYACQMNQLNQQLSPQVCIHWGANSWGYNQYCPKNPNQPVHEFR
jgi:hypothetical protein